MEPHGIGYTRWAGLERIFERSLQRDWLYRASKRGFTIREKASNPNEWSREKVQLRGNKVEIPLLTTSDALCKLATVIGKGESPLLYKKTSYEKQIEALSEISQAISSDRYLDDILKLIVTVTANVTDSKICSLWILDEKNKVLKIRATQTMSEEYLKERSLKWGEGVVGYVAQQNRPLAISDVLKEPRYKEKELAKKEGLVSMLSVPLAVKDKVIGVINCYTSYPHEFTSTERHVLTTVANQAAVCIENTELIVKTKVIQEELETRKLVERAKGILMKHHGLGEEEAFKRIRKASMDSRKTMREIADAILLTEKMGG